MRIPLTVLLLCYAACAGAEEQPERRMAWTVVECPDQPSAKNLSENLYKMLRARKVEDLLANKDVVRDMVKLFECWGVALDEAPQSLWKKALENESTSRFRGKIMLQIAAPSLYEMNMRSAAFETRYFVVVKSNAEGLIDAARAAEAADEAVQNARGM